MRVGDSVTTLDTVRPRAYANVTGTVSTRNENEYGVMVNGRLVWFLEREIRECQSQGSTQRPSTPSRTNGLGTAHVDGSAKSGLPGSSREGTDSPMPTGRALPPMTPYRPVANPPRGEEGSRPGSSPLASSVAVRPAHSLSGFTEGARGPGGGIVAKCQACERLWERPKQRGKPRAVCPGCRQ